MPTAYLETSFIGYLTSRPSNNIVVAGHQEVTRQWWHDRRHEFQLLASQLVWDEAAAGDTEAAQERLRILESIPLLDIDERAELLAGDLIQSGAVPQQAADDALHIAVAAVNGADYLLTWNCRHIANAAMRQQIEQVCRSLDYKPTIICTPEELLGA